MTMLRWLARFRQESHQVSGWAADLVQGGEGGLVGWIFGVSPAMRV